MASNDVSYLRLQDFDSNMRDSWKKNQRQQDFCDVTLACDDKQIETHKFIISSCSPVLKNILKQNSDQHPLIFLRGVKYNDLENLVNFMYQGVVNIHQEELKCFLALAKDLEIKGLSEDGTRKSLNEEIQSAQDIFRDHRYDPSPKRKKYNPSLKRKIQKLDDKETENRREYMENWDETHIVPVKQEKIENWDERHIVKQEKMENTDEMHIVKQEKAENWEEKQEKIENRNEMHIVKQEKMENRDEMHILKQKKMKDRDETHIIKQERMKNWGATHIVNQEKMENWNETHIKKKENMENWNEILNVKQEKMENRDETLIIKQEEMKNWEETHIVKKEKMEYLEEMNIEKKMDSTSFPVSTIKTSVYFKQGDEYIHDFSWYSCEEEGTTVWYSCNQCNYEARKLSKIKKHMKGKHFRYLKKSISENNIEKSDDNHKESDAGSLVKFCIHDIKITNSDLPPDCGKCRKNYYKLLNKKCSHFEKRKHCFMCEKVDGWIYRS